MWKIAISRPFWFFYQPLLSLSKNCLLVTCITNLKRILVKMLKLSRLQGQIIDVKWENRNKSAILNFFSAIIELVQELLISNMHNKFEEDMWKTFQVIAPTRSNYWRKMRKITINRPFFFSAIIELVQELLISNIHTKFEENMWKTFQVIAPTGSNYWRKMRKIAINRPFFFFFGHYWTSPRTTY